MIKIGAEGADFTYKRKCETNSNFRDLKLLRGQNLIYREVLNPIFHVTTVSLFVANGLAHIA